MERFLCPQEELKRYVEQRWTDPEELIGDLYETESTPLAPGMGARMVGIDMSSPVAIMRAISEHSNHMRARD